jgi:carboxyl-terminal processing protease
MIHRSLPPFRTTCLAVSSSLALLSLQVGFASSTLAQGIQWKTSPKDTVDQSWQIVYREYVDPKFNNTDWLKTREELLSKNYDSPESAYTALRSALSKLEDPYTRFLDPEQYKALTSQTQGELSGVGMRLRQDEKTRNIIVDEVMANSPALKAGVQKGDVILSIDGKSTQEMEVGKAASLIRGTVGTAVKIVFQRQGTQIDRTLTRAEIEVPSVSYTRRQEKGQQIGYIRLSQFTSHAAREMRDAIRTLAPDVQGFVLDLRGNPGGLLTSSIDIARMWIDQGTIVKTVDRENHNVEMKANSTALTHLPLMVLVDQNSASSSEILAGALKDNRRGVIVGHQTFGKALVQSLHALEDGSGVAVTIAHYYTPNGTDIGRRGLAPDVTVNLSQEQEGNLARNPERIGTENDPQYMEAITYLQTWLSSHGTTGHTGGSTNQVSERP